MGLRIPGSREITMTTLWQNLRHTIRALGKDPGFAIVSVLSLAMAIGANTAIFSLLDALLLRDLPVRHPERLVELSVVRRGDKIMFSYPMFREIERGQKVFSGLIGWSFGAEANVESHGELFQANVRSVTGNYYSVLGAAPLLGRLISTDDKETSPVAVIGYEFWQRRFGGVPDVVGKEIAVEGHPYTIIGVTRKWFTGMSTGEGPDITTPMKSDDNRALLGVFITGRLKDGVTLDEARGQLQSFWPEVLEATVSTNTPGLRRDLFLSMGLDVSPAATGVNQALRSQFTRPLYVLMGIVGLILLVACVNLATLLLARAAARSHETSVRVALGATRLAVARQVLAESLALSACGALVGLALAYWGSRLLVALMTEGSLTPVLFDLRPDWRVLSLTASVSILTGILFGLAPAWRSSREDPATVLQQTTRGRTGATGRLGQALIVAQVVLSMVLLLGAGLLVRSFRKLGSSNLGFEKASVLELDLARRPGAYQNLDVNAYHRQLFERISNLPGVDSVGFSDTTADRGGFEDNVAPISEAPSPSTGITASAAAGVAPGFFRTLGISLVRGRDFDWNDDEHHPHVVILSSSLAERLFPFASALGQRIRFSFMPEWQNLEVIGVVSDARFLDLHNARPSAVYLPLLQSTPGVWKLFVRTRTTPEALARVIENEVNSLGREYSLSARTIEEKVGQALVEDRVIAMLSSLFGALALLLASIGLYGLMSYSVSRRTREIGLRAALGAQRSTIIWLVLREALALVLLGVAVGIPFALAASRFIASMLFGISRGDLATIAAVSLLLLASALVAGYLPAWRASSADPVVALRTE
ncbi:MAG: ABC transporter permease [Acidobacteria bacterium]|nr:ABC transporter permease [Acidobacteriota bacterium]